MKEIALKGNLGKGKFALVNNKLFKRLNRFNWFCEEGTRTSYAYRRVRLNGKVKTIRMHHLIIRVPQGMFVDHIDGNGLNNQRSNLRIATRSQNARNRRKHKNNTSGYKGVFWNKNEQKYTASIGIDGKAIHIGDFKTAIEAADAYDQAAIKYHGQFANVNLGKNKERVRKITMLSHRSISKFV